MDRPKSRLAPALIVAGVLCAASALYVVGYFYGCEERALGAAWGRGFRWRWQCAAYSPAAWIEARVRGSRVSLHYLRGANIYESYDSFEP
jgi:hypothetical protein